MIDGVTVLDEVQPEVQEQPECPFCGSLALVLGPLGRVVWYRCRDCGIEFVVTEPDQS